MLEITTYIGTAARPFLRDIAELRISVFREFPYLYDGSFDYEMDYLSNYYSSEKSLLITVKQCSRIIGLSTAAPLADADQAFQSPVLDAGMYPANVFYFGESVVIPEFRGNGLGRRFFDLREEWANRWGFPVTAFCAVLRAPNHPQRPPGYKPLDSFWNSRGYNKREDLVVKLPWKEVGNPNHETAHDLAYWLRETP